MPDGHRRSREGWADAMEDGPPAAPAHTHRLPPVMRIAVVGLAAAVFLLLIGVGLLATYVYQQQQYIQGRGELRDQETARLEEQIRQAQCDLLDTFPEEVPALERARAKYECGPGIPRSLLTPEERARYGPAPAAPPAAPPPTVPVPPMGSAAVPNVERPEPAPVPPRTGPGPDEPAPPPESPRPITELVCDLAGVCI